MKRFPDWPQQLWRAIEDRKALPHAWGSNDCALYAADLVKAQTGQDFAAAFRGLYTTEEGARALLAAHGWADLTALVDHFLPRREGRPRRGDVLLLPGVRGPYLAVMTSGAQAIAPDVRRPTLRVITGLIAAWEVA